MLKTRVCSIEEYVKQRTKENGGKPSKIIGSDGFEMDLTVENYIKLRDEILEKIDKELENKKNKFFKN